MGGFKRNATCEVPQGPSAIKGVPGKGCCLLPTTLSHVLYGCSRPHANDEI